MSLQLVTVSCLSIIFGFLCNLRITLSEHDIIEGCNFNQCSFDFVLPYLNIEQLFLELCPQRFLSCDWYWGANYFKLILEYDLFISCNRYEVIWCFRCILDKSMYSRIYCDRKLNFWTKYKSLGKPWWTIMLKFDVILDNGS